MEKETITSRTESWKDDSFHPDESDPGYGETFAADLKFAADGWGWNKDEEIFKKLAESYGLGVLEVETIEKLVALSEGLTSLEGEGLHVLAELEGLGVGKEKLDILFEQAKVNMVIPEVKEPDLLDKSIELVTAETDTSWQNEPRYEKFKDDGSISAEWISVKGEDDPDHRYESRYKNQVELRAHFDRLLGEEEGDGKPLEGVVVGGAENGEDNQSILDDLKQIGGEMTAVEREQLVEKLRIQGVNLRDTVLEDSPDGVWERQRLREAAGYVDQTFEPRRRRDGSNIGWISKDVAADYLRSLGVKFEGDGPTAAPEPIPTPTPEPTPTPRATEATNSVGIDWILSKDPGEERNNLVRAWINNNLTSDLATLDRAYASLGIKEVKTGSVEIPNDELGFKREMRKRVREIIRLTDKESQLSLSDIEKALILEISREMGLDTSKGGGVYLFPTSLEGGDLRKREKIKNEVEAEISARVNLRRLQIQEETYKSYESSEGLKKFISDMKGNESNPASPSIILNETYDFLRSIDSLGEAEGATTKKVDAAFSVLLKLGNNVKDPGGPWDARLNQFVGRDQNIFHPEYLSADRARAMEMIGTIYGEDARDLAWQLFQAYKEEGNYTWKHYLNGLFKFSESRAAAVKLKVYTGSRRVLEVYKKKIETEGFVPFSDEVKVLANSALRVPGKVGIDAQGKDVKERALYYERAMSGEFLQATELTDPVWVKNHPEMDAYNTFKAGDKVRTAITVGIGALGAETDKISAIPKAQVLLSDIRTSLNTLVDLGVIKKKDADKQVFDESLNVLWELSIYNPLNVRDLSTQTRDKPKFLLPSKLADLMIVFGGYAGKAADVLMAPEYYDQLKAWVGKARVDSLKTFKRHANDGGMIFGENDQKKIDDETRDLKAIELPEYQGGPLIRHSTNPLLKTADVVFTPGEKVARSIVDRISDAVPGADMLKDYLNSRRTF